MRNLKLNGVTSFPVFLSFFFNFSTSLNVFASGMGKIPNPSTMVKFGQYIQVPEPDGLYYYPFKRTTGRDNQLPVYVTPSRNELGKNTVLLKISALTSIGENSLLILQRAKQYPDLFVYNKLPSNSKMQETQISGTNARTLSRNSLIIRKKRSPGVSDMLNQAHQTIKDAHQTVKDKVNKIFKPENKSGGKNTAKKVIHLPTLFIDNMQDGFENIFYQDMIVAALCLTNQPDLDRHEIRDEYEALACTNKGYAAILPDDDQNNTLVKKRSSSSSSPNGKSTLRRKREDEEYHFHDADSTNWHMDKSKYDTLWKIGNSTSSTTTTRFIEPEIIEDLIYDYEFSEEVPDPNNKTGWEEDEAVDPEDLDFIVWPQFLPITGEEKVNKSDQIRSKLHNHPEQNYTLNLLRDLLRQNHSAFEFDRHKFALNESVFLSDYYTYIFNLSSFNYEGIIEKFFKNREKTLTSLTSYPSNKLTLETIRELFILFIIDVHHVNCFNRHIRFYGYVMKRPASINGDEITNDGRLTRGIIMRGLELIRHIPQYNNYKEHLLRLLIAALKERASVVKHSTKHIEENDYTELFEVASYLEHLLQHGIHPDEKNQDLFVQETRFYAHHFMNTLTL